MSIPLPPHADGRTTPTDGSKKPLIVAAIVAGVALVVIAVLVALLVLLRPPAIATADGDITNAAEFLDDVEDAWDDTLPSADVEVSDDAACYFVFAGDVIEDQVACGGARRVGSEDGHTWDLITFTTSEEDGGVEAANPSVEETSVVRPDATLRDADGEEPPGSLDDVGAVDLPEAQPGLIVDRLTSTAGLDLTDGAEPGEAGVVRTPTNELQIESVLQTDAVPTSVTYEDIGTGDSDASYVQAAEGETFYIVDYAVTEETGLDGEVTIEVESDGETEPVLTVSYYLADPFLVSAPEGAQLLITSEGHSQAVDLATGEREDDPVTATYYWETPYELPDTSLTWPAFDLGGEPVNLTGIVRSSGVGPFNGEAWAPEGKAYFSFYLGYESDFYFEDLTIAFTVTTPDGETITGNAAKEEYQDYVVSYVELTPTGGQYDVSLTPTATDYSGNTATLGPQTYSVTLEE